MALVPLHGRFLHLIPDDKFIDAAYGIFQEALPGGHDFLFIGRPPLHYLRTFEPNWQELALTLKPEFLSTLPTYSAIFVHTLSDSARLVIASAPLTTRFIWLGWGFDFYHLISSREALWLPKTQALLDRSHLKIGQSHDIFKRFVRRLRLLAQPTKFVQLLTAQRLLHRIGRNASDELTIINRFTAIATPILEDFEAMCSYNPEINVPFLDWNYWTEGFSAFGEPTFPTSNDILLGNSATPENNHLDALDLLSKHLPAGRRIICPLSYGNKAYGDVIEQRGTSLFGNRFVALREYMPSASYMKIIHGCSLVIMYHIRQQALGNIIMTLCSGARVFLHPKNPIKRALSRIGVGVSTTDSLPNFLNEGETERPFTDLQTIRQRIDDHYGRSSILHRTKILLESLK